MPNPDRQPEQPDPDSGLGWLGPDFPKKLPSRDDFRRYQLMDAAKMYLEEIQAAEAILTERVTDGVFLEVRVGLKRDGM